MEVLVEDLENVVGLCSARLFVFFRLIVRHSKCIGLEFELEGGHDESRRWKSVEPRVKKVGGSRSGRAESNEIRSINRLSLI